MSPINYQKYPPNWKERVERIRKRANNKCEICGTPNGATVYAVKAFVRETELNYSGTIERTKYKQRSIWFNDYGAALRFAENPKLISEKKVVCTTAHLDHDEGNWDVSDDRLMFMCQMCHLRYDRHEKFRRKVERF